LDRMAARTLPPNPPLTPHTAGPAMSHNGQPRDPDDMFSDTRMTFGEHIEELRWYLWRAIIGFLIAMFASFFLAQPVLRHIIISPVEHELQAYYAKRVAEARAKALAKAETNDGSILKNPY